MQFHQSYTLIVKAAMSVDGHYGLHSIVVFTFVSAMCCVEIYALAILHVPPFAAHSLQQQ